jgi:hypothetical protein
MSQFDKSDLEFFLSALCSQLINGDETSDITRRIDNLNLKPAELSEYCGDVAEHLKLISRVADQICEQWDEKTTPIPPGTISENSESELAQ